MAAENGRLQAPSDSPTRRSIRTVEQTPPVSSQEFPSRKPVPYLSQPEVRLQESPSSPVNINPPRPGIQDPETASIKQAPDSDYRFPAQGVQTPDSAHLRNSSGSLPYRSRPSSGQAKHREDGSSGGRTSTGALKPDGYGGDESPQENEVERLQYSAFDEGPRKREHQQHRVSQATTHSVGSSSGSEHKLRVPGPGANLPRPASTYSIGADKRGRTGTPMSAHDSDTSSPNLRPRDVSTARRSPGLRPHSYIDLLNEVPYSQQIAPGGSLNNAGLQSVIGNAASLLDTKKTLEMYRANVKKTNDAAVQYEFAIFMINASQSGQAEGDADAGQLMSEAKSILQRLSDRAYPFAQYYLGDGYFSGVFNKNKPDYDKAFPLFVAASKHGHAEAGYRAALCYEFAWGTARSYPKAVQFYRNSASKAHPGAATRLGMACLKGDMGLGRSAQRAREGLTWLKRATESADFQYNSAPYELGLLHLNGFGDDVFKDEAYALQLVTQAAELGHVKANFLMGQAYESGLHGCPPDAALSVHFYNGAAVGGMPEAMMALCAWYMVGAPPVLDKDEGEACAWAKQAAETGTL